MNTATPITLGSTLNQALTLIHTVLSRSISVTDKTLEAIDSSASILNRTVSVADQSNAIWANTALAEKEDESAATMALLTQRREQRKLDTPQLTAPTTPTTTEMTPAQQEALDQMKQLNAHLDAQKQEA